MSAVVALLLAIVACEDLGLVAPDTDAVDLLAGVAVGARTSFGAAIREIDPEAGILVLESGLHVHVNDSTCVDDTREVTTLAEAVHLLEDSVGLAAAGSGAVARLEAGDTVVVWGEGEVESEDAVTIVAVWLTMKVTD